MCNLVKLFYKKVKDVLSVSYDVLFPSLSSYEFKS